MTERKEKDLRNLGYSVVTMWECQFLKDQKENQEMREFVEELKISDRLKIRDALNGGHTNASVLYASVEKTPGVDAIKYVDFTS